jgi:hypothetical protein
VDEENESEEDEATRDHRVGYRVCMDFHISNSVRNIHRSKGKEKAHPYIRPIPFQRSDRHIAQTTYAILPTHEYPSTSNQPLNSNMPGKQSEESEYIYTWHHQITMTDSFQGRLLLFL